MKPLFTLMSMLFLSSSAVASDATADRAAWFLDSNGALDVEAVRASGYDGPIRADRFQFDVDPGAPAAGKRSELLDPSRLALVDSCWSDQFPFPGLNGDVEAMVEFGGELIVGGGFTTAGVPASHIAAWDGSSWRSLGEGMNGPVAALTVWDDGIHGERLIAGGDFTIAGQAPANRVAAWDGVSWSPLGGGTSGDVEALTVWNGQLVAGGEFLVAEGVIANGIASWNGTLWSAFAEGMEDDVRALTVFEGDLVAGGYFTAAGTTVANGIARWDGAAWHAFGAGVTDDYGEVEALAVYDGGSGDQLYMGGYFDSAGLSSVNGIARWNGVDWEPVGSEPLGDYARELLPFGGELIAATSEDIEAWDGASWRQLGFGLDGSVDALGVRDTTLVVGYYDYYTSGFNGIATWNGLTWTSVVIPGINGTVFATTEFQGDLVIGGAFTQAGSISAGKIARWNGSTWSDLGGGMYGAVYALAAQGDDLYAGGFFTHAGGVAANNVARWNGIDSTWNALGPGVDGTVRSILVDGDSVYIGGSFGWAGINQVSNVALWDGSGWSDLDGGLFENYYGSPVVNALFPYAGMIVAGGRFDVAGDSLTVANVAGWSWADTSWSDLGAAPSGYGYETIHDMTVFDDELVVAVSSDYDYSGEVRSWDGATWNLLGTGFGYGYSNAVHAVTTHSGRLVAGGDFFGFDGVYANHLAQWNGMDWAPIDEGVYGDNWWGPGGVSVYALTSWGTALAIGGEFQEASDVISSRLALYQCPLAVVDAPIGPRMPGALLQNFPNPFRPFTTIRFDLPRSSRVNLGVFDVTGRRVRTLRDGAPLPGGVHDLVWDGRDADGRRVASGVYFYRIETETFSETRKMTLLR